jgi:hypothetical protein
MWPRLAELLYWMACWIAVMVSILGIAAMAAGGRRADWAGTIAFFSVSAAIWLFGRVLLLVSKGK